MRKNISNAFHLPKIELGYSNKYTNSEFITN